MRGRRIKMCPEEASAVYHCMSRTVNGEFLFGPEDQEILRRQIWLVAQFCGVEVLTYTILSNHFHLLIRVPKAEAISDDELFRRYALLYPKPTKYQTVRLEVMKSLIQKKDAEGLRWRDRMLRLMGDISNYLKLVKQRFSVAYNKRHKRYGTLWAERFKSVLLEEGAALRTVAAYIDLNCVRAGLTADPKDYRFCGYGEAVAGEGHAQSGLQTVLGQPWSDAAHNYRQLLFGTGAAPMTTKGRISSEAASRVMREHGKLRLADVLRCRVRFFTDGAILGSRVFVQSVLQRSPPGLPALTQPQKLKQVALEGPLAFLCALRTGRRREQQTDCLA